MVSTPSDAAPLLDERGLRKTFRTTRGRFVETGATADVFERPQHACTRSLLASSPSLAPTARPALAEAPQ